MRREEVTRELVEETLAKINPSEIPTKNLPKSGTNQSAYYLLYNNEFYPPKYVINQCGYDSDNVNSIEANSVLKSLGFEICDSNTNEKVLKIILKNFYKRAYEGTNQQIIDITRRVTYKGFKVHASFGKGNFSATPFIAFLKDENTSQNGVYPFTHFDRNENSIYLGLGVSQKEVSSKVSKLANDSNMSIEEAINQIRKNE